MHCYVCDTNDNGRPDSCDYTCDTTGDGTKDSCFRYDTDGDGHDDSCSPPCPPVGDETEGSGFRCDSDDDGIPDTCEFQCDTDGDGVPDACHRCDTNDNGHADSCAFQCNAGGGEANDACFSCDIDGDGNFDACAQPMTTGQQLRDCANPVQTQGQPVEGGDCGTEGGFPVPDNPVGGPDTTFLPCCEDHDICWGTCGKTHEECDRQFRDCMLDVCADTASPAVREVRRDLANQYADAVGGLIGQVNFNNAQIDACSCCQ